MNQTVFPDSACAVTPIDAVRWMYNSWARGVWHAAREGRGHDCLITHANYYKQAVYRLYYTGPAKYKIYSIFHLAEQHRQKEAGLEALF